MSQPSAERLALLYRISQAFSSSLDITEVLNRVMDEVVAAVHAERGFLMLYDAQQRLTFRSARGMDQQTIETPEFQVSRSVVERVAHDGIPMLTSNAQSDAWLGGRASIIGLGLRSILCVPLHLKQTILGVIYVDNHLQAGIFSHDDLDLLVSIAASAAVAIENARLYQVAVEKGRLERELQVARAVQSSLLPQETPALPGVEIGAWWLPAREVSGDYYDYLKTNNGSLIVVIADVSDKGMPAALLMALTRSTVRACLTGASSLALGIANANRLLAADAANGMFVTLFCAEISPHGEVTYVNAGHNPPLLVTAGGIVELRRSGTALGLFEDATYSQRQVQLAPGDFIVFYTDGVTDAMDPAGAEFGKERLLALVQAQRLVAASALAGAVAAALQAFTAGAPAADDITLVVVRRATAS
jgi:sigma-B regulation protein RsbU (phosphoserine phosphatase)